MVPNSIKLLFDYARKSIRAGLEGKEYKPRNVPLSLKKKKGVFVTLTINGRLRGCMGIIVPEEIWKAVIRTAAMSAFEDPRFPPLTKEEFGKVEIEISLLSQPKKSSRKEIKKGDGVIIRKGAKGALFLPQVWEELPDKESFLRHLFMKAGIYDEKGVDYEVFHVKAWKLSGGVIKPVNPQKDD